MSNNKKPGLDTLIDMLNKIGKVGRMKSHLEPLLKEFQEKFNLSENDAHVELMGFVVASYENKFGADKAGSLLIGAIMAHASTAKNDKCTNKDCPIHGDSKSESSGVEAHAFGGIDELVSFLEKRLKKSEDKSTS